MKEVKNNKKPFIFYYTIVIVIMILLNMFVFPRVLSPTVKEVGYDTFLTMLDKKEIKQVQVENNQIIFSDNADPVNYYTQLYSQTFRVRLVIGHDFPLRKLII